MQVAGCSLHLATICYQSAGDGAVQFCDLTKNRKHYEVSRMFAATLQLVGTK